MRLSKDFVIDEIMHSGGLETSEVFLMPCCIAIDVESVSILAVQFDSDAKGLMVLLCCVIESIVRG